MGNLGIAASGRKLVAYRDLVVADGPISYYRLGDAAGAAVDEMARANGTYLNSPTRGAAGMVGDMNAAVTFNGTTQNVDISDTGLPTGAAVRTLEAWIKTTDSTHANADIVGYGTQTNTHDFAMRNASGQLALLVRPTVYTFGGSLATGLPIYVVVAYDGTNAIGYVNGAAVGSPQAVTPVTTLAGATGLEVAVWANFFTGTIDEVAIYGYALSSSKIADHYRTAGY